MSSSNKADKRGAPRVVSRLSEALGAIRAEQRQPTQADIAAEWRDDVLVEFRSDPRLTVKAVVLAVQRLDDRVKPPAFAREISRLLAQANLGRRRQPDAVGTADAAEAATAPVEAPAATTAADTGFGDLLEPRAS
ncbi:hypothetical protein [Sphingomonas morindae]|uniref:Uncharacterized protein n=1 Tax=Sphingomonas morindae TaxID=1541170 RepID=A0ABY4X9F8_9SPHN|nr:hypothetical protein [Sphingomonas morindae]USI73539.1 hypothetical protein LHA26_03395 [Sphingomonas morindae]